MIRVVKVKHYIRIDRWVLFLESNDIKTSIDIPADQVEDVLMFPEMTKVVTTFKQDFEEWVSLP